MPSERLKTKIQNIYEYAEALRLAVWEAVEREQDELIAENEISEDERFCAARAEVLSDPAPALKIIVDDIPPRTKKAKPNFKSYSSLRMFWVGNITTALKKLPHIPSFDRALITVKIYSPSSPNWDVDNKAVNFILNALRINNVIPNDTYDHAALLLIGEHTPDAPYTEIIVREYSQEMLKNIL